MNTSLFEICHRNDLHALKQFLPYSNIHNRDAYGNTILHYACYFCRDSIIEYLIKTVPDLHMIPNQNGNYFLHILIKRRCFGLVHYTLKHCNMYFVFDDANRDGETISLLLKNNGIYLGYGQLALYYFYKMISKTKNCFQWIRKRIQTYPIFRNTL